MIKKLIEIAKNAGQIQLKYYKSGFDIQKKNNDMYDLLTSADLACDKYIYAELKEEFPDILILSEENKKIPGSFSGRVFMVDPLDGTKEFVAKNDQFACMIGLCKDGIPTLGVVYAPALDKLYWGEKGKGSYLISKDKTCELEVSELDNLERAILIDRNFHGEERPLDFVVKNLGAGKIKPFGSVGLKLGLISRGKAHIHVNSNFRLSKWDSCAPQIILEEAGGKVTDLYGDPLDYKQKSLKWENSVVATNGVLHNEVITKINSLLS
ncbi:3'(2'),5'-bisphosphate nucleotidase CysQ [Candidatus Dojkabacteria bacterium]|nr:3'(2'),5'-bisphosphate nucleotidase CysQ [Candidatus Dojkabacteria bacterium]